MIADVKMLNGSNNIKLLFGAQLLLVQNLIRLALRFIIQIHQQKKSVFLTLFITGASNACKLRFKNVFRFVLTVTSNYIGPNANNVRALGVEPRTRAPKARMLPHTLCPVRTAGFEPTISCTPSTRNTKLSHVLLSSSCGNRTHLSGLKGQNPKPIEERAMQWIGWCSNPRLRLFRPPLNRLSYQSNNASSVTRNASKFRTQTTVIRFAPPKRNRNQ